MNNRYSIYKSNIDKLIGLYPDIFNKKAPKPLAIGLYQQLAMDVHVNLTNTVLRSVLMIWTKRHEYLRETIKPNAVRYNLDGSVHGEVSAEHRLAAIQRQHKNRLASKRARRKRIQLEETRVGEIDNKAMRDMLKESSCTRYVIEDDLGLYYSGYTCGVCVWKNHVSRAAIFYSNQDALDEMGLHGIDGNVVEITKWW